MAFDFKNLLAHGPEAIQTERVFVKEMPLAELGLTCLYVVIGSLWFMFADEVFDVVLGVPIPAPALEAAKGINFIVTSGLVLYLVLRRAFRIRRQAEEALRLSQQRFEVVALATTDAIWDLNIETRTIWRSDSMEALFGYKHEDMSNHLDWWLERLHP